MSAFLGDIMKIKPRFYLYDYDVEKVIKVINQDKQKLYIKNGLYPCDIYVDNNNRIVMIFEKKTLV